MLSVLLMTKIVGKLNYEIVGYVNEYHQITIPIFFLIHKMIQLGDLRMVDL